VKVLVVDPDLRRAPALKDTLTAGGAEVTVAASGSFALTMLEWNRHDVVVCRARIDDMEGHELCAILKSDPGTRGVRFVLVAGADEVDAAQTAAAGVDMVLPPNMTGSAILPLVVRLMQADRVPAAESASTPDISTAVSATPEPPAAVPAVPRIRPAAVPPPPADPPKRYATAATVDALEPWSETESEAPPGATRTAPVPVHRPISPAASSSTRTPVSPARAPELGSSRGPTVPALRGGPASTPPRLPAAKPPSPAVPSASRAAVPARTAVPPKVEDLLAMPSGTFQGSMEVMELADLTQAIAAGGKSGRLILALPQGGGLILFEKGRVVHAEYRNAVGEEAFGALLAACHADGSGRFCFLPAAAGEASGIPRTIDKTVDRLLLSSATAIDEKG
jgi:CheY-like chemotaxis protein